MGVKKSRKQIKRREKGYGGEGKGRNRGHPTPVILLEKKLWVSFVLTRQQRDGELQSVNQSINQSINLFPQNVERKYSA